MNDRPDERTRHSGWRAGDEPGGPSGPGNEPLVYERYLLDWEWKNYLGCLWLPSLVMIIFVSQWLSAMGVAQAVVQWTALAAVFGTFLVFGLIDLSGYHWDWRRALIWLWLPGWAVLWISASVLHLAGLVTLASTGVLAVAFWLFSRSKRRGDV